MAIWDVFQEATYLSKTGPEAQTREATGTIDDTQTAVGNELIRRFGPLSPDPSGKHTAFPYSLSTNPGEIIAKVMFTTDLDGRLGWFTDRWSPGVGDYIVQIRAVRRAE